MAVTSVNPLIEEHREAIRALAHEYGVARLEVFGSVCTPDWDPARSDVDFLVEYPEDYDFGLWLTRFFALEEALAELLGRDVDLVMTSALRNRWFNREAAKTRMVLYDASEISEVA
jgi:predicted nucleotidyltransferase